jgi:predicted ferric reductase
MTTAATSTHPARSTSPVAATRRLGGRARSLTGTDLALLVAGNGVLILGMWIRHGGLDQLATVGGILTAGGQLTALYGTYAVLIGLVLMARDPWLDRLFGLERLASMHRVVGFASIGLLAAHGALTTIGWSLGDGSSVVGEAVTLLTQYPYVLWATVGMAMLIAVGVTSARAARRRLSYDTWYGIHLYAYLGVALTFLHQLVVGTDFADDPVARLYWIGLYALVAALLLAFRFGRPIVLSWRHRLRVAGVVEEASGAVSVYLTGRDLDRLPVRAGQYFRYRFLTPRDWWHAHPFSLSASPNGRILRFTAKTSGDWSSTLARLRVGTRVLIEGPNGHLTEDLRTRSSVVLIAGGIGITPLRALFADLAGPGSAITLIYRASRADDVIFRSELEEIARRRGAHLHVLVGRRGREFAIDPLGAGPLGRLVRDIRSGDVYICGPDGMIDTVRASLDQLGVDRAHVHWERFRI